MLSKTFCLLVFCLLATLSTASPLSEKEYETLFTSYLKEHGKAYDVKEFFSRFNTFKDNLNFVIEHNLKAEKGEYSFTLAMNQFGDWTNEEYKQRVLGLNRKNGKEGKAKKAGFVASGTITSERAASLPASFDWRTKGAVNAVKDQGQCGSCWSFSATTALETAFWNKTGTLLSLSEQLCVDCVDNGADTCDVGGEMHDCYLEVLNLGGEETEGSYPYTASSGAGCQYNKTLSVPVKVTGYVNSTQGDENALLVTASESVVSIGIDASSIWFQLYFGGVYDDPSCKNTWADLDHGVAIVGWGHDTPSGKDYWIVRNSWGAFWGQAGYIWMLRGNTNACGVATDATLPILA